MLEHDDVARVPARLVHALLALSQLLLQHRHHRAVARRFRVLQGSPTVLCVCVCVCVCVQVHVRERERRREGMRGGERGRERVRERVVRLLTPNGMYIHE